MVQMLRAWRDGETFPSLLRVASQTWFHNTLNIDFIEITRSLFMGVGVFK
jgi:hypothetical protein